MNTEFIQALSHAMSTSYRIRTSDGGRGYAGSFTFLNQEYSFHSVRESMIVAVMYQHPMAATHFFRFSFLPPTEEQRIQSLLSVIIEEQVDLPF
jgi:hypothetical protein